MAIKRNIVANLFGRLWAALMNFAFVPLYIHFLGIESYGLVGFFVAIIAVFTVLDMGLSVTINRELAKLSATNEWEAEGRNLLRTFEVIYWGVGLILSTALILAAPTIAIDWLRPDKVTVEQTTLAVRLMGVAVFFRWPQPLYAGALMGLGKQVLQNGLISFGATLQGGGAVLALWIIAPSIEVFFLWHIFALATQATLLFFATWRSIPAGNHHAKFTPGALSKLVRFSAGVAGISFFSVILTQSDKFLLSKLLPLEEFGYYALSSAIAGVLTVGATAVYAAIFPAMAQRVAAGDTEGVSKLYRQGSQLLAMFLFPVGLTVAAFSKELVTLYTGSAKIAMQTHSILSLLAVGNTILSIMVLPLALQLAYGWTKLSLYKNIIAVILYVPLLATLTLHFGSVGAALTWVVLTLGYLLFEIPMMHRKLLKNQMWPWYIMDIGISAVISMICVGAAIYLAPSGSAILYRIFFAAAAASSAIAISACILLAPRAWAMMFSDR